MGPRNGHIAYSCPPGTVAMQHDGQEQSLRLSMLVPNSEVSRLNEVNEYVQLPFDRRAVGARAARHDRVALRWRAHHVFASVVVPDLVSSPNCASRG